MMRVDAVVLAGAENDGRLRAVSNSPHEALIDVGGRPMVQYVLDALAASRYVERIVLVGPAEALRGQVGGPRVEIVPGGERMVDNIRIGLEHLGARRKVLLVTSDIPLLTAPVLDDFLERCQRLRADIYYPIVPREQNEAAFPGVKRTYVRLREGVFTGGNLVLIEPAVVARCAGIIEQAVRMRKKPLQLGRLLGVSFIIKLLANRLTLPEIEERVGRILGFQGVAVITPYPEIGIDVDKPSDLELVRRALANGHGGTSDGRRGSPSRPVPQS